MLETATTTELHAHYAQAHVARAKMFRSFSRKIYGLLKGEGPQLTPRPSKAVAC